MPSLDALHKKYYGDDEEDQKTTVTKKRTTTTSSPSGLDTLYNKYKGVDQAPTAPIVKKTTPTPVVAEPTKKTTESTGLKSKAKNIFTSKGLTTNKEGFASGLAEGFEEGTLSGVAGVESAIGFGAKKLGYKAVAEKYAQKAKEDTERLEYIQQERGDEKSVSRTIGGSLPALFITTGATVAAPIIGTAAATAAGVGTIGTMALGTAYQKAKDAGADEATATKAALGTGLIEASLELIPFRGLLKFLPKKAATGAVKEITRSFGEKVISGLKSFGKQGLLEAPVEALQQVNQNAWEETYNENKKIFDQVPESALFGFLLGGAQGSLINGYFNVFNKLSKKGTSIDKDVAYNTTAEMQVVLDEYVADKSKVVEQVTSPNGSNAEISVITFEDGKTAVSAKVTDKSGNTFDLPYTSGQIYESQEEAVGSAKKQIDVWAKDQGVEAPIFDTISSETDKKEVVDNQKTLKVKMVRDSGTEIEDVEVIGFGKIAGKDVFVSKSEDGKTLSVSDRRTGLLLEKSKFKTAKRAISDVSTRLIQKAGTEEKLTEMFDKAYAQGRATVLNEPAEMSISEKLNNSKTTFTQRAKAAKELKNMDASLIEDLRSGKAAPAKSIDEMKDRIDQLNKFGQARAILRRTGGLSKKAAGVFRSGGKRGEVRLQNSVVMTPEEYVSVMAHELGHALEYNLVGATNVDTYRVFGEKLTPAQRMDIKNELKQITNRMVGEAVAKKGAGYYYKDTELLARFLQRMFENPGEVTQLAPKAVEYLEKSAVTQPIIQEYLDAVFGNIDKGTLKTIFLRDMRQTYQKVLGNRVGDMVWKEEIAYRSMKERAKIVIERLLKDKFKNIKDAPELLFRAAEAITVTENGVPQFGTRNFANAKTEAEVAELMALGWEMVKDESGEIKYDVIDGESYPRFAQTRYTPEQGKRFFNDLSPAGKQLIKEFTARKEEAKDLFNRNVIKNVYKINSDLEGWVHHYFDGEDGKSGTTLTRSQRFKLKKAGTRKQRTGTVGYVEDLQKAMQKALTDLQGEKEFNDFIDRQFARVTKPIAKGEKPDIGWVEVVGNLKRGVGTPEQNKMVVVKDGKVTPIQQTRYQMPEVVYQRYKLLAEPAVEASKALRVMNSINRYWRVNILFHPGSAATNLVSGGVQYATKMLTDFYTEVLTGNIKFEKTRRNVYAMMTVLTPKGWQSAPDWIYGSDLSNFYGQFGSEKTPGILDKSVDLYADKTLKVYGVVERYWKKVIAVSENAGDLKRLEETSVEGFAVPTEIEKQLLDEINKEVDLFAYDYDNTPMWLENFNSSALGQTFKPFLKYPYKYSKQIANMIGSTFDRSMPWQERMAKLLSVGTIIAMYAYIRDRRKEEQKTEEVPESAPASVSTRGRLFIGTDENGNEIFTRVAKYPFINITETGAQFLEGNTNQGFQSITDMIGSIAPSGKVAMLLFGFRSEYEQYTPGPILIADQAASFVPGTRILQDISRYFDPYQRKKTTVGQSFTSLIPVPSGNEDLLEKLRGKPRTIQVPEEGSITGATGKRTTIDMDVKNYKNDILLGLLGGIYSTRIDPDVAEAFIIREEENAKKKKKKAEEK